MQQNLPRRAGLGVATVALAAVAVSTLGTFGAAGTASADTSPTTFTGLILGVGSSETSRTLAWYSSAKPVGGEAVELATDAAFATKQVVAATVTQNSTDTGFNGETVLSGLKPSTTYYYRVVESGTTNASSSYSFTTGTFGNGNFQFLFFGDPQIGSSGDPVADGNGWNFALDQSRIHSPMAELYVSGGDQVNTANNETEWNNFLKPDELRSIPWAATIGNHDNGGRAYDQHFALPGTLSNDNAFYSNNNSTGTNTGGDYWFAYKGVLFIDLNSNAYSVANGSDPAHVKYVTDTIAAHKTAETKHVVLVYHHSIYSPADHANDTDNQQRRGDFTKAFSDAGVDLVLQGHDHSYSRSYALKGTALGQAPVKADANEQPGQPSVVEGPGGVIYVTANSASGSKYYDLTEPDATKGGYGPDTKIGGPQSVKTADHSTAHVRHWANSVENQEHLQTYVEITVNDKGLRIKNIRANDGSGPNAAVDRKNVTGIGPELGSWALPIGSVQDQVDVFRSNADVSPILPPADVQKVTETVPGQPTATPTVTVTQTVPGPVTTQTVTSPATAAYVDEQIASAKRKLKKAKGVERSTLRAELKVLKAVRRTF